MSKHSAQEESLPPDSLLQSYSAGPGVFDELEDAPARPRTHWRPLIGFLQRLGRHELESRWENGRRILREHGVTYNMYGDPQGTDRSWGLDFVPLIITAEEWARIEAGLIQRSRLFNLILADIYGGSQRLLRDGFLAPELVYANPGFLRPCRGIPVSSHVYLHMHACDLGRSPDGQWWVLSDRTQAPSGTGYAWENRTVVSRILPEQIRDCRVQRLANFFQQQRNMLFSLAPPGCNHPNIVLLTPGPQHELYFEHAYLARHLGFALVEGADLTVRDRRVFLKTIEGLQPIHVILRRVGDSSCDPLELSGDSLLGVSGLVEATRAGNVTVANALGSGLMESPAFLAFLPILCRHLLGEELLLPSVATWWCGQGEELRYVTQNLNTLVIRPAFNGQPPISVPGSSSGKSRRRTSEDRAMLLQRIRATPSAFVAQEQVRLSRAPAWSEDGLTPMPVVVRAYVANGGNSVTVMPGGLTRISRNPNELVVSMRSGSGSKDTWVLSDGAAVVPEPISVISDRGLGQELPSGISSRAADHLFWLGRYTERLEQLLRIVRCVLGRVSAEPGSEDSPERRALAELVAKLGLFPAEAGTAEGHELSQRMLQLLYHPDEPGGARELLNRIRSSASAVRDRFSGDTWRILGRLDADSHQRPGKLPLASATALSHNLVFDLAAFNGMEMENMTRGRGWRFLDFGRRLERGLNVVKLLAATVALGNQTSAVLESVLEIADSVMTYRRRYFALPQLPGVLALVLVDDSNPRSLAFQINLLHEHSAALMVDCKSANPEAEQTRVNSLAKNVRSADVNALAAQHAQGRPQPLADALSHWAAELEALSNEITGRYFSHSVPHRS